MTSYRPQPRRDGAPKYVAIADAIAEDIGGGRVTAGTRLPPQRNVAYDLRVTLGTVSRAYGELARRGLVHGEVGRGTFVLSPAGAGGFVREDGGVLAPSDGVNLWMNAPAVGPHGEALRQTLAELAELPAAVATRMLQYQPSGGAPMHRAAGAAWLGRRGLNVPAEQVLICTGAQHAIVTAFSAVCRPGDIVLAECLTYPGVKNAARLLGLRLEGVALDEAGVVPDAFEAACRRHKPAAAYLLPTLQNPTTVTMPAGRREAIAEIAARFGVAIVEDDIYGSVADGGPLPIAAIAPERVLHIGGLSKSVASGLRVSYLSCPDNLVDRAGIGLRSSNWMTAPLMAEIAARWIADGTADRLAHWQRGEIAARFAIATAAFAGFQVQGHAGCPHLWLPLPEPWRAPGFVDALKRRGVTVTGADAFAIGRSHDVPHAVRVSLTAAESQGELRRGLDTIATLAGDADGADAALV